jgi:hypothetical protein
MFKGLKDFKRRSVQTLLETVGTTDNTVDEEFNMSVKNFQKMLQDMNECESTVIDRYYFAISPSPYHFPSGGASLHSYLSNQKIMFSDAKELSLSLARIYELNNVSLYVSLFTFTSSSQAWATSAFVPRALGKFELLLSLSLRRARAIGELELSASLSYRRA